MPFWAWIIFYVLVLAMLVIDLRMFAKKGQHEVNVKEAMQMTAVWIGVSLLFCHTSRKGDGVSGRLSH